MHFIFRGQKEAGDRFSSNNYRLVIFIFSDNFIFVGIDSSSLNLQRL